MKKNSLFLLIAAVVLCLSLGSCKKKKQTLEELREEVLVKPQMELSQSDTTEVMSLVNRYLTLLQEGQVDDAIGMMYFLNKDSIVVMPESMKKRALNYYSKVRAKHYEINSLIFLNEKDCQVKYTAYFTDDRNPSESMGFYIKPVRRDGKWYLTLADSQSDTNVLNGHGTEIQN